MGKTPAVPPADRYLVPGLLRGLELLQLFTAEEPRHSQAALAARLGVTRSAIFRIVYTLTQQGFLLHDPATRLYSLGPAVLRLGDGFLAAREVLEVALPVLERLRDETGWSAHLAVREARDVLYLLRLPTRRGQASIVHVGSRLPAEATAMGRVLLADLPEAALMDLYRDAPSRRAGGSLAALARRARADRASGLVEHLGSFEAGVASLAAPLRDGAARVIAAINVTAPLAEAGAPARRDLVRQALLEAAGDISRRLGASAPVRSPPAAPTAARRGRSASG